MMKNIGFIEIGYGSGIVLQIFKIPHLQESRRTIEETV